MKKDITGVTNISYVTDGDDIVGIEKLPPKEPKDQDGQGREPQAPKSEEVLATRVLTPEEKEEKSRILRNIIIISFSFFFLFTSYNGMTNLQSSLNKAVGTASLTGLYIAYIISCCLTPSWVLQKFQEKNTMIICMLLYSVYMAAQFYPTIYTLMPTALVLGLAAAPLWSAKCTYLTKVSDRYGDLAGEKSDVIVTRFFGIFFLFFQATQIVGNLISSLVLSFGVDKEEDPIDAQATATCGYHFCIAETDTGAESNSTDSSESGPPLWQIYTMAGIYLGCALISALIIFLFLDPLSRFKNVVSSGSDNSKTTTELVVATFNHMRHPYQILIIPLTIWSGVEQAFLSSDFTAAYVSCTVGVHMVGYIMIFYGACDAVCSYFFSPMVKKFGRVPVFSLAFLINISITIALTQWRPQSGELGWFFIVAGLWGVADAVWQTQINSFYGVIFPGESAAAFSNYRLWESLGFFIAYVTSTVLCTDSKITILFILLVPGIILYYVIEFLEYRGTLKRDNNGKILPIDKLIKGHS